MAYLYKRKDRGNRWYIRYYRNGRRYSKPCKTTKKSVAKEILAEVNAKLSKQEFGIVTRPNPMSLEELAKAYLERPDVSISGEWRYMQKLYLYSYLLPFFGKSTYVHEISSFQIESYQRYRLNCNKTNISQNKRPKDKTEKVSPRTINLELTVLRSMCNWAANHELINSDDIPKFKMLKVSKKLPRYLSTEESQNLLSAAKNYSKQMHLFVALGLYTGLRLNELRYLDWENIDLEKDILSVKKKKGFVPKSGKERNVPIPKSLKCILSEYAEKRGSLFIARKKRRTKFQHSFRRIVENAGLEAFGENRVTPHTMRHTYASHLVMNGVPLYTVSKLLGHSSVTVTEIYAHLAPEYMSSKVVDFNYANE